MKNKIFPIASFAVILGMASCSNNDYNFEQSFTVPALNLITDLTTQETILTEGSYDFKLKSNSDGEKGVISTSNILINNNKYSFQTVESDFNMNMYEVFFKNVKSTNDNLGDNTFLSTSLFNVPRAYNVQYTYLVPNQELVAQYILDGRYMIKTFQENTFYTGVTNTTYPYGGSVATATNDKIYYLLNIDTEENPYKASLIMFNAKFSDSEREPVKTQINVNDLSIDLSDGKIVVSGKDVIPETVEGGVSTPIPSFIFNEIEFSTTNENLTQCSIKFKVAGVYTGSFTGSYLMNINNNNNNNNTNTPSQM